MKKDTKDKERLQVKRIPLKRVRELTEAELATTVGGIGCGAACNKPN